jgi:L-seryl-tRNA(Ser) seleniumtransferase
MGRVPEVYARLGVKPVINAQSWVTMLGGSLMRPEVLRAMDEAATAFVDLAQLTLAGGETVARACAAEAGLITAGASSGNLLMAAAAMTGTDRAKVDRLPDTTGMKNEILIFKGGRNSYDKSFITAGAKLVEFGSGGGAQPYHLEAGINEKTAGLAWIVAPFQSYPFPLEQAIEICHARGVPVLVDAAAEVPPIENLTRFTRIGADMVTFSGGKGIGGPQNAGLLAGGKELIEAAFLHMFNLGSGTVGIGRPSKVPKETVVGMATALDLFLESDHVATWAGWRNRAQHIVDRLQNIPGLHVVIEDGDINRQGPNAVIYMESDWNGPSPSDIRATLAAGDPSIRVGGGGYRDEINIVLVNVQPGEEEIIADRLEDILRG